jgi:TatA/E family protein of Tat protein translocase
MSFLPSVAFLTDSVGTGEWIVLFVVILVVIGPKRMPEVARKIGRMMEMFRRAADEFRDQLMSMDQEAPAASKPASPSGEAGAAEQPDAAYSDAYPNLSDYPGNEEHVENWHSDAEGAAAASDSPPADGQPAAGAAEEAAAPKAPEGQA